jgi:protein TonB
MMQLQYNTRAYRPRQTAQQRLGGVVFIAALHVGIVYALLMGLKSVPIPVIPRPFDGQVITKEKFPPPPPIPPQPQFSPPRITDNVPPFFDLQLEPGPTAITEPLRPPRLLPQESPSVVATPEPTPATPLLLTPARALAATHTIPDYPPVSRRLGEQGTLRLRVAITTDGTVSDAQVESSSGHQRLDQAAVEWVKTHWRYEPAREGAKSRAVHRARRRDVQAAIGSRPV